MLIFCCMPANCVVMASKTWVSSDVAFTELVEVGYRRVVGHLSYFKGQLSREEERWDVLTGVLPRGAKSLPSGFRGVNVVE
jgi:hypothetical protein